MSVDPNDFPVDWSTTNSDSNINIGTQPTNAETSNPLITSCTEGANSLISHEIFTEGGFRNITG